MDSNAIKEIANQLGVGADYLLNHLSEFAPKWAAMQAAKSGTAFVFTAIAFAASVYVFVKAIKTFNDSNISYCQENRSFALMLVFGVLAFVFFTVAACSATDFATYIASPETAMLRDILQAMQQ